jgi:hypothetical protein
VGARTWLNYDYNLYSDAEGEAFADLLGQRLGFPNAVKVRARYSVSCTAGFEYGLAPPPPSFLSIRASLCGYRETRPMHFGHGEVCTTRLSSQKWQSITSRDFVYFAALEASGVMRCDNPQ